jgi:hypothetical protein
LITHKEHLDKFENTYSFDWSNNNNKKYMNFFGSKNIIRAIKETQVLFILGNKHYGSNSYEKSTYFYFENLPNEIVTDFKFNILDKDFSFLRFDIKNHKNKINYGILKNPYDYVMEKSIESNTEWALNQFKLDNINKGAGIEKVVVIYGKVPTELKKQITLVEHSLKPEILYLLILKILSPNKLENLNHEYFYFNEFDNIDKKLYSKDGIKDKINSALRIEYPKLKKINGKQEEYYIDYNIRVKKSILFAELGKARVRKTKLKK